MHLHDLTIKKFHEGLASKQFKALEIVEAYFKYIEDRDKEIGAYLSLDKEGAYLAAEQADLSVAKGEKLHALSGVPVAVKDVILIKGQPATAGSKILEKYTAAYDATAIKRLRDHGAVFLGKTNCDEFAMGSSNENSAFKPVKNPHDPERVPGGSSGGSATAVAGHMALAALGSDTGGSIRQPASFCGVVGLKPTYGAVSRFGLIAMSSSLDQIGPFARTVEDAAILFKAMAGHDRYDATSAPVNYGDEILKHDFAALKKMKIGLPEEYFIAGVEPEVVQGVESVIEVFKSFGAEIKKISLPHTKYALSDYYIVMPAEVSSNLARYDGIRYGRHGTWNMGHGNLLDLYKKTRSHGFGAEVKRRIILGTFVLSSGYYDAYYAKAQKVRALIKKDFTEAFKEVDLILTPVAPTRAFKFGEKTHDPLQMYLSDIFTIPANLAGVPAISLPVKSRNYAETNAEERGKFPRQSASSPRMSAGLPIGFQLIARPWREADLFNAGRYYEEAMA